MDTITLSSGNICWGLDPDIFLDSSDREIKDPLLALCPVYSKLKNRDRAFVDCLKPWLIPKVLDVVQECYRSSGGTITARGKLRGKRGVHPSVAVAMLWKERPPVMLRIKMVEVNLVEAVPWKQKADFREIMAWACHRYGGVGYHWLAGSRFFDHLSERDKIRSVIRVVQRVARNLRDAAASSGVTIEGT